MQAPSLDQELREAALDFDFPSEVYTAMEKALRRTAQEVMENLPPEERDRVQQTIGARYDAEDARVARSRQHLMDGAPDPEWQAQLNRVEREIPRLYHGIPYEDEDEDEPSGQNPPG